jgi:tetratricopeptide (TPR) repeat protein
MRVFILIFLFPIILLGATSKEQLSLAKNYYQFGDYKKTIEILEKIIFDLEDENDQIKSYEILGACHFFEKNLVKSGESFRELLTIDSSFKLDVLLYPPPLIQYFEKISEEFKEKNKLVKKIEQDDKKDEKKRDIIEVTVKEIWKEYEEKIVESEKNPYFSVFVPFGYAQFRNGELSKGNFFLTAETILLSVNIISYWMVYSLKDSNGYYSGSDKTKAEAYQSVQLYSLIGFVAVILYGTIDGVINYKPIFQQKTEFKKGKPFKVSFFSSGLLDLKVEF